MKNHTTLQFFYKKMSRFHKIIVSLQRIFNSNTYLVMKTGDNVLISPETPSGEIYFDKEYQFKPAN